jgi:hypothetical protein
MIQARAGVHVCEDRPGMASIHTDNLTNVSACFLQRDPMLAGVNIRPMHECGI